MTPNGELEKLPSLFLALRQNLLRRHLCEKSTCFYAQTARCLINLTVKATAMPLTQKLTQNVTVTLSHLCAAEQMEMFFMEKTTQISWYFRTRAANKFTRTKQPETALGPRQVEKSVTVCP